MAFGFGVGDIIALTNIILRTVGDIHDAPEVLQDLALRVEMVEITLESIHDKLSHNAPARSISNIVRLKDRVKEVLSTLKNIVEKYRDNEGHVNPFHRIKYSVWEKQEIANLLLKLDGRTKNLTDLLLVQTWDSTNQIRPLIEQVLKQIRQDQEPATDQCRSKDKLAACSPGSPKETEIQTTGPHQIDQVQAVLDQILQTERPNHPALLPDQEDLSIEKEIVVQLEQAGIGSAFIKSLIEVMKKKRKQLSHAEDIDPLLYTGGNNHMEDPKGWIMVVDSYNEVRSIIAQTYLELVRLWTVNNSGGWLFNRVESAGVQIETRFAKRCLKSPSKFLVKGGGPPESAALKAISGKKSYFRSHEKNDILERIAQHRSRGIDNWHFRKYEYMLCFDRSVYETVKTLARGCKKRYGHLPYYANLSKIILIDDIKLKDAAANLDADATTKLVGSIKDGIKSFLKAELHWTRPPLSIRDGQFRTRQIVLPRVDVKLSLAEEEAKLNEISAKTDCRIRLTDEKFDSQLLSITGRSEALPFASSLLREALL